MAVPKEASDDGREKIEGLIIYFYDVISLRHLKYIGM